MRIQQQVFWIAGSVLALALLLSAAPAAAAFAAPLDGARQSAQPWTIRHVAYGGVAGKTLDMLVSDSGVVDLWSRSPAGRVCFSVSAARLRELNGLIARLDPSVLPHRPARPPVIPDMPSSGLTVTSGGRSIDIGRTRQPAATSKRLHEIVSELVDEGRARVRASADSQPPAPGAVPCPPTPQ